MSTDDPLVAAPPAEIPLSNAPLVRVIAQIRFPLIVSVEQRDFIGPFQEVIRDSYPVLRREQTQSFVMTQAGTAQVPPEAVWRFSDAAGHWRVSLAPEFVALETTSYTSRSDFLARLRQVVGALDEHVEPKTVDRVGVRYVDRVTGANIQDITKLVRPEVQGIAGTAVAKHAQHSLSETLFALDGQRLLARWGRLPENQTVDPAAIEPIPEPSWILDLDMFTAASRPFDVEKLLVEARTYAERIYTFFRWAVTDEFLRRYGGTS